MSTVHSSLQVHDLTNNPLAVIPLGNAKIKVGYIRIVHPIDLIQIGNTIYRINREIQKNPFPNALYELIQIKNQKLYETFLKLKPFVRREKRWDSIGTVWKWIAGNPDAEDLKIINSTMNSLINQNNKQVMINTQIGNRIQEITSITNQILTLESERLKNQSMEMNQLIMLSNLDSLQNQVETLEEAILMAKHGIPSSKLLSVKDFSAINTFLAQHDIYITSFEELLSQSTAQVTLNKTHIAYILKVPQLSAYVYEYDYIDSITKSNKRIALKQNHILRNNSHIYELTEPCEEQNNAFLCDNKHLTQPSNCISYLIQGQHSNCTFERVYSGGLVKRINAGTILINDAAVDINSNCSNSNQALKGSFLIQFEQCNLFINGELFANFETTITGQPYHPTTGLLVFETNIIDSPPVEYLKNLTLTHRDQLDSLRLQNNSLHWKLHLFGSLGASTVILTFIGIGVFLFLCRKPATKLEVKLPNLDIPLKEINSESSDLSEERKRKIESFLNMPTSHRPTNF